EKVSSNKYDMIFMDINMPVMNGVEATKIIRKNGIKTPIIGLSANAIKSDIQEYLSIGIDSYLTKPIITKELEDTLMKYSHINFDNCEKLLEESIQVNQKDISLDDILDEIKKHLKFKDAILLKLLNSLVSGMDKTLLELEDGIKSKNFKIIEDSAHKIAGSSGNLRLHYVYEISKAMQNDSRDKIDKDYKGDLKLLKEFFSWLSSELS
ncbi:MAG: response regulator, partial [Campylobacterota bacterium]|nr:response regulator [Campylobacterota bacterium]